MNCCLFLGRGRERYFTYSSKVYVYAAQRNMDRGIIDLRSATAWNSFKLKQLPKWLRIQKAPMFGFWEDRFWTFSFSPAVYDRVLFILDSTFGRRLALRWVSKVLRNFQTGVTHRARVTIVDPPVGCVDVTDHNYVPGELKRDTRTTN